jgi:hypothetical protein
LLWTAVRSLEERSLLIGKLADNARIRGHDGVAALFQDRAAMLDREAQVVRDLISRGRALEPIGHGGT